MPVQRHGQQLETLGDLVAFSPNEEVGFTVVDVEWLEGSQSASNNRTSVKDMMW